MRTRSGILDAVVLTGLFVVAGCQGGGSLGGTGPTGGIGGQTHPGSAGTHPAGGAPAGGARGGSPQGSGGAGASPDGGASPDAGGTTACKPLGAIPRRLWRLSAEQWGNAVQSLLNLPSAPVLLSRGGELAYAAFSDATLTVDSAMLYAVYGQAGQAIDQVDPVVATTIAPCTGTTADAQTDCATSFARAFASRAYRRAVSDEELSDLMSVYQDGAADG
ncbi:MAG TPA: hypothetical protein VHO67_04615, partial [Polyangia bacterium]|nr:hypothetical protein [Polyangia bacterium]